MKVWSWRQAIIKSDLESPTKLLLLTLAVYMNDVGQSCFPSITQLERDTGLTRPTIITHTAKAERAGFLKKTVHKSGANEWARNEYLATYPQGVEVVKDDNHPSKPDLPPLVKEFNQGSKGGLGGVVKEVYSNSPVENSPIKEPLCVSPSGEDQTDEGGEVLPKTKKQPPPAKPLIKFSESDQCVPGGPPAEWYAFAVSEKGWGAEVIADVWAMFFEHFAKGNGKNEKREIWFLSWKAWVRRENIKPKYGGSPPKPIPRPKAEIHPDAWMPK